jgi:hypothetical protein
MKKADLVEVLKKIGELASSISSDSNSRDEDDDPRFQPKKGKGWVRQGAQVPADAFRPKNEENPFESAAQLTHSIGKKIICDTDSLGFASPENRSPLELVLDASEGFIPLWTKGVTLRWRFHEASMSTFQNPQAAKTGIRALLSEAILAWGDAAPIKFNELRDAWDFEIIVRDADRCNANGCVLASAFFPDGGRHQLVIYPQMFSQAREEQVETLVHELGHVFGLRHFFAKVQESQWPSEVFGEHKPFTIMNYGEESMLTDADKSDLKKLYRSVWRGELTEINGTPIKLVKPFHDSGSIIQPAALSEC